MIKESNSVTESLEILENGLVKDLLNDLFLNSTEYTLWLNDGEILNPNDSFVSQGVQTRDKLFGM